MPPGQIFVGWIKMPSHEQDAQSDAPTAVAPRRTHRAIWRSVQALPEFRRLLELRAVSQFGDGLFQAGLAGALLFNPERATGAWAIAGAFSVLFLPYSLLGPFAGALLDRWDRRGVLIVANLVRLLLMIVLGALLATGAADLPILVGALVINGFTRFVSSGLSAALPHVVPAEQVVSMNSLATAVGAVAVFLGANFMLLPRWLLGAGDAGAAAVLWMATAPVALGLWLSIRIHPHMLGPDDSRRAVHGSVLYAVATGWGYGLRTVIGVPTVTATLGGLAAHRVAFGINTLVVLVMVRHGSDQNVAGFGVAVVFVAAAGLGSFMSNVLTPAAVRRWGRYATANGALVVAALFQLGAAGLHLPVMIGCGLALGCAGQVVKLCADSAMQIDVDDALRGHVFTVQDSLFWIAFVGAIAASASVIPADGRSTMLVVWGALVYLVGLAWHAAFARRTAAST
jgi:hypothetical protein